MTERGSQQARRLAARARLSASYRIAAPVRRALRTGSSAISPISDPIAIYTMEKVGTQTILASVESIGWGQRVAMAHTVSSSTSRQATRSNPLDLDRLSHDRSTIRFVTSVRDPIERDISLFFEVLPLMKQTPDGLTEFAELFESFVRNETSVAYLAPLEWFETEWEPTTGLPYQSFGEPNEYEIRAAQTAFGSAALLVRLEDFPGVLPDLMTRLTGIHFEANRVRNANRGAAKKVDVLKPHYGMYSRFKREARLSKQYVTAAYADPVIHRFYDDWRARFTNSIERHCRN